MLKELRFVQGAAAKKDFIPALTHFHIDNGVITGYNGALALSCPIPVNISATPKAMALTQAIKACEETIALHMTPAGRLSIKSGNFRTLVDCTTETFPDVQPVGVKVPVTSSLLKAFQTLTPFVSEDASRPWSRGILLRGQSAYATNNIIITQFWLGSEVPFEAIIPRMALVEILRIGEEPTEIQVAASTCTFHYSGGRWLRTSLVDGVWPDVHGILGAENNQHGIPEGLWPAVERLIPFTDELNRLFIGAGRVSTGLDDNATAFEEIASLEGMPVVCFNAKMFRLLKDAISIDFLGYPKPCIFFGPSLRGAIVGMRHEG